MNILIKNNSTEPIYEQIYNQIKEQIIKGILKEGESLPSIRSLAQGLRISVITTKRAYEELTRDGYIETYLGKGSFVKVQNKELLKEECLKRIENNILNACNEAHIYDVSLEELKELLIYLFKETEN